MSEPGEYGSGSGEHNPAPDELPFDVEFDEHFDPYLPAELIEGCVEPPPEDADTWHDPAPSGAAVPELHDFSSSVSDVVRGPDWVPATDPFADLVSPPHDVAHEGDGPVMLPDDTAGDGSTFEDALVADYTGTWTADAADHNPPLWDAATSAQLANLTVAARGGVDATLLGVSAESPAALAAQLWRDGLLEEPLPVDDDGQPLEPIDLLSELIGRLTDPAQADVARSVRESLIL